ncbi:hypothetical protein CSPX01_08730 [Colletotrichum filicis]|nr:hypothetical protein CSPX01_08730 [Colletotrichum filicis]
MVLVCLADLRWRHIEAFQQQQQPGVVCFVGRAGLRGRTHTLEKLLRSFAGAMAERRRTRGAELEHHHLQLYGYLERRSWTHTLSVVT